MKNYRFQANRSIKKNTKRALIRRASSQVLKDSRDLSGYESPVEMLRLTDQNSETLFRLFVKKGEYVYARPNDIIMIESCDHLVRVYVAIEGKVKLTMRYNTLKDFLLQLPKTHFIRIGRFCALNVRRLTGGNCNEQAFEFDFKISIKPKHIVSHSVFNGFGK